jgi:hypothetical protein
MRRRGGSRRGWQWWVVLESLLLIVAVITHSPMLALHIPPESADTADELERTADFHRTPGRQATIEIVLSESSHWHTPPCGFAVVVLDPYFGWHLDV